VARNSPQRRMWLLQHHRIDGVALLRRGFFFAWASDRLHPINLLKFFINVPVIGVGAGAVLNCPVMTQIP
jgi:hypothetical protein